MDQNTVSATGVANSFEFPKSIPVKCGPSWQIECCVEGCHAKYGQVNVSFHRFPRNTSRDALRRDAWIQAAGLTYDNTIVDNALICGQHFERGKPSLATETNSPNWAPTLKLKPKTVVPLESIPTISTVSSNPSEIAMNIITPQRLPVRPVAMGPQVTPQDYQLPAYCRLCLAEDVHMVFPKDSKVYHQLVDKIKECLNLELSVSELAKSLICKKCYETLEQLQQFRARCIRQNIYLNMRKSLEPDRNQLLRYKDNWYWYSCLGNGMNSIIWGCSVVCCPAFIVSHPSGKICSKYATHQHKQKMDDVKAVYCHGEYIYDGYRYSFEVINSNRTLTFSCRSLHDPYRECPALLITNDRSEVLSVSGIHNHEREVIIESAVKDGFDKAKRSVTIIRSSTQEIVFCQGFWYTTIAEQSSISHWNCIRSDCSSVISMVNGVVRFYGTHKHLPVLLKWGAEEDKTIEPRGPTLMKVVNPTASKMLPARVIPPVASRESTTIVHSRPAGVVSIAQINEFSANAVHNVIGNPLPTIQDGSLMSSTINVESSQMTTVSTNALCSTTTVRPPASISSLSSQPLVVSAAAMSSKVISYPNVTVRSNHPIQVMKRTTPTTVRVVPPPRVHLPKPPVVPPKPPIRFSGPAIPKIVHVMSLNLNHSSNQPKPVDPEEVVVAPEVKVEAEFDDSQPVIKDEPWDEPETITDEVQPTMIMPDEVRQFQLPKPPPLTPRPMQLVSSASVVSDNTLSVTSLDPTCGDSTMDMAPESAIPVSSGSGISSQETVSAEENEEDGLTDLQDDEEIPPIVPIDADLDQRMLESEYTTRIFANGKTQLVRKLVVSRRSSTTQWASNPRPLLPTHAGPPRVLNPGYKAKSIVARVPRVTAARNDLVTVSSNRDQTTKMYGPLPVAQQRSNQMVELGNSAIKSTKEPMGLLETTVVDTDRLTELDAADQEQPPVEDPIAVSIEPHQNVQVEDDDEKEDEEEQEEGAERSSSSNPTSPPTNESENCVDTETSTSIDKPAEQNADRQQATPVETENSQDSSLGRSDKKAQSKTVQLVKLQKTEQMLNHEGHLYKIKWHNHHRIYWDCMLREQVNCMAILETQSNNSRYWHKIGSHNHKVPKPIINDDNRGRYQMLTNDIGVANVKILPVQTLSVNSIKEQEGRMMHLAKRKMFNFKIQKHDPSSKLTLCFDNYEYEIRNVASPGFRWKCTTCNNTLETDEKFTIAQELGSTPHNHEPELTVINLVDEGTPVEAAHAKTADESQTGDINQQQSPQATPADVEAVDSGDQNPSVAAASPAVEANEQEVAKSTTEQEAAKSNEPPKSVNDSTSKPDSDAEDDHPLNSENMTVDNATDELKSAALRDEGSDDEAMVLDPSTGELCKSGDLKRKEYRKAIMEDIVADDDDDEAEYLDPLTGKMRRKGDKSLFEADPVTDDEEAEKEEGSSQPAPSNIPPEDFEELLNPDPKDSSEGKKSKRPKKDSLAALKLILTLHKQLRMPDTLRNFEVLPSTENATCLIRFNEYTYELDTIQDTYSVWKCHLSPQYACRGKVHLTSNCRQISISGVNHCHVPTLKDMFIDRPLKEEGQIKDTDQDSPRDYTFFKRPDHAYQLKLDDGYLYNCITISKTGVSCWRCVSRQRSNCKAIITMEGEFKSMVRNRFSHSHDPVDPDAEGDDTEKEDHSFGSPITPAKRASTTDKEDDRKKRKRQTL